MGRGVQKRVQPDLVERINKYEGSTFSERLRALISDLEDGSSSLSTDDVKDVVENVLGRAYINQHQEVELE